MSQPSSNFEAGMPAADFQEVGGVDGEQDMTVPVAPQAPVYRKQGFNIYSVLLILSFVFLTTAAIVLFMQLDKLK